MRFSAIALTVAVPAFVSAVTQNIKVGDGGQLSYDPPSVVAALGDIIEFSFESKNHSVTQSTFTDPCTRSNVNNTEGFSSGFNPVSGDDSNPPTFQINVTQTAPIWFYCGQTIPVNHCQMGMVGVINPTPDKTLDLFKAAAMGGNSSTASAPAGSPSGTATSGSPSDTASGTAGPSSSASSGGTSSASVDGSSSGSPSVTASGAATTKTNGAMRLSSGAAGLLTLVGVVAGVAL